MLLSLTIAAALASAQEVDPDERDLEGFSLEAPEAAVEAPAVWELLAGGRAGLALPLDSALGAAGMPLVDLGLSPPIWGGRLRVVAGAGITAPSAEGSLEDPAMGQVTYTVEQRILELSGGLEIRALRRGEVVSPVFAATPGLYTVGTQVTGADFEPARERHTRAGLRLSAGVEVRAGPGAAGVRVDWLSTEQVGDLAGAGALRLVHPSLGYRVHL